VKHDTTCLLGFISDSISQLCTTISCQYRCQLQHCCPQPSHLNEVFLRNLEWLHVRGGCVSSSRAEQPCFCYRGCRVLGLGKCYNDGEVTYMGTPVCRCHHCFCCWLRNIPTQSTPPLLLHISPLPPPPPNTQTVKYLYLSFVDSGGLLDYYVLSTEGHIMPSLSSPVDAHVEEDDHLELLMMERDERLREKQEADAAAAAKATCESGNGSCTALNASQGNGTEGGTRSHTSRSHTRGSESESESEMSELSLVGAGLRSLPANCRPLCAVRRPEEERAAERTLHRALPLLPLELRASRRIR